MKTMVVPLDVEDLARFANLATDGDAAFFQTTTVGRDARVDFAPKNWWEYPPTASQSKPATGEQWRITQMLVRDAWDEQFQSEVGLFDLVRLLTSVFEPAALLESLFPSPVPRWPQFAEAAALADEYGFHKAIRYLSGGSSWRMKRCANSSCGRRFVADHNARKCCSSQCSSQFRQERQKEWGRENNWGRAPAPKSNPKRDRHSLVSSRREKLVPSA
jgi:hypothetical protein